MDERPLTNALDDVLPLQDRGDEAIAAYYSQLQAAISESPYVGALQAYDRFAPYAPQPQQVLADTVRYLTGANS